MHLRQASIASDFLAPSKANISVGRFGRLTTSRELRQSNVFPHSFLSADVCQRNDIAKEIERYIDTVAAP